MAPEKLELEVRSLWSLHQYRAAYALVESIPDSSLKDQARLLKEQSELGNHDLSEFYVHKTMPTVANYVGPVYIKNTLDGRGRGLFLSSDVSVGDLLIVANPLASIELTSLQSKNSRKELDELVVNAYNTSPVAQMQVESILRGGIPSMEIFQPNVDLEILTSEFRSQIIHRLGRQVRYYIPYDTGAIFKGFYPLRCFINHSCTRPNVSVQHFGKVCFVYAYRDMKAGTELLSQYSSIFVNLLERRRGLKHFCCWCARCRFEEEIQVELKKDVDCVEENGRPGMLEEFMVSRRLSTREKGWLRASYFHCYMECYFKPEVESNVKSLPALEEYIQDCQEIGHEYKLMHVISQAISKFPEKERVLRPLLVKEEFALFGRKKNEYENN